MQDAPKTSDELAEASAASETVATEPIGDVANESTNEEISETTEESGEDDNA